jgi:pimeloyl-ACP methyl ester carboxylesterase
VADVVSALRREKPGAKVILAGHSMGGGIAMRYAQRHAERRDVPGVDGYLLFAPHLGERSPTAHPEPGGGVQGPAPIRVHVRRLIGLVMLNVAGVHGLDGLDTLYFDLPFDLPIRAYTFRAVASMAPDDYRPALTADALPMLVVVGQKDEAFRADAYPAVAGLHRNGKAVIVEGETHDGVLVSRAAMEAVQAWIPMFHGGA